MRHIKTYTQKELDEDLLKYSQNNSALQKMRELIKDGANIDCVDVIHRTSLIIATNYLNYSIIKLLLENGADINIVDKYGDNCLFYIVKQDNYTYHTLMNKINIIVDLIITHGIDMNIKNNNNKDIFGLTNANPFILQYIIDNYPEKYKDYLLKKEADKFNL